MTEPDHQDVALSSNLPEDEPTAEEKLVLADETQTHDRLQHIFFQRHGGPSLQHERFEEQFVMRALRTFPKLASQKFKYCYEGGEGPSWYPLVHLLYRNGESKKIQEVCKMHPEAISGPLFDIRFDLGWVLPLAVACTRRRLDLALLRWMAELHPAALTTLVQREDVGQEQYPNFDADDTSLPIHAIIRRSRYQSLASEEVEVIKLLLEVSPECASLEDGSRRCSLTLAAAARFPYTENASVLKLISQAHWEASDEYHCDGNMATNQFFMKNVLEKVLDHLRHFTLEFSWDGTDETDRDTPQFLRMLRCNTSIQNLTIECRAWDQAEAEEVGDALELLLKHNNTINHMRLSWIDLGFVRNMEVCLQGVRRGLENKKNVEMLHIYGIDISETEEICSLLSAPCGLSGLLIDQCIIGTNEWLPPSTPAGCSRLKEINFSKGRISSTWLLGLLYYAAGMPLLESVKLEYTLSFAEENSNGFTDALLHIMTQGSLREWKSTKMSIDVDRIYEALKENNNLTSFQCDRISAKDETTVLELLVEHNTTLGNVGTGYDHRELPFSDATKEKVMYLSKMNRYGRGAARSDDLSLPSFVELLCSPLLDQPCPDDEETKWHHDPLNMVNIQCGLLKECPSLWSTAVDYNRKRKRDIAGN